MQGGLREGEFGRRMRMGAWLKGCLGLLALGDDQTNKEEATAGLMTDDDQA